jgi:guanine deaminase
MPISPDIPTERHIATESEIATERHIATESEIPTERHIATESEIPTERAFRGTALHAPTRGEVAALTDVLIVAGADGSIQRLLGPEAPERAATEAGFAARGLLVSLAADQYWLPGLVDLHVHAPQWPQLGKALERPLEEWLQAHTFPLEARFADLEFAAGVYESLVDGLLANGTTTATYYASLHLPATQRLADICLRRGQRALIGRTAMDEPAQCPDYYRDSSAASAVAETRAFIDYVLRLTGNDAGLVKPVVTPRFIPACSDELLVQLGRLARETGCHVQTHCSESDWEHSHVLERCGMSDAAALDQFGLLSRRTILAHGNFVGAADLELIRTHGAGIAHCPLSNVFFSDAVFPLRRILERGVHVGLGTDIAGGASPSILDNARQAVIASRSLESGVDANLPREQRRRDGSRIDALTAFWLATAGGGMALDLPIGQFREGYQFDAIRIDGRGAGSNLKVEREDSAAEALQKIIYHASRADIREVWVANRRVHGAPSR